MPKKSKMAKRGVLKGDGRLDALFARKWETLKVFWTFYMSVYLMEPIRDNRDFKEAVRNVKNVFL